MSEKAGESLVMVMTCDAATPPEALENFRIHAKQQLY
jgi:hypothetical protein